MNLTIILIIGLVLTIVFHFIGVYAKALKWVWIAIILIWAGAISLATQEIKPKGYSDLEKLKGKDAELDRVIDEAMPTITVYEMIGIKKVQHERGVKDFVIHTKPSL